MNKIRSSLLFLALVIATIFCTYTLYSHGNGRRQQLSRLAALPQSLVETTVLNFHGIASDYIMLHILSFMGEKVMLELKTTPEEWQDIYRSLRLAITLDPYATDPFILATTTLPHEAGLVTETNELLEEVAKYRTQDYRPYFFLWYNHYYYLDDLETAAYYLKKAASVPGAPKYFFALATRMHLYSGKIESSIAYTKEVLRGAIDQETRKYMLLRLEALRRISYLEDKAREYKKLFYRYPTSLKELVSKGIINEIPKDPYGGVFYILKEDRVYTTSKLVPAKGNR